MGLRHLGYIELPEHVARGGFDHAAVDRGRALLYVAHTANDAVDVIDTGTGTGTYVHSISNLTGVAGALVHEPTGLVFTSNRGENTVGLFSPDSGNVAKIPVGLKPNGLAYDEGRGLLLCANVGDPSVPDSPSATMVDVPNRSVVATVPMPGRTRWTVFDSERRVFFVNIADPPVIVVIDPGIPGWEAQRFVVPARGPHGLELDPSRHRLYSACDEGALVALDSRSGEIIASLELSGGPDVIFLDRSLSHLYVAVGTPGVIDVIDVETWERKETVSTGPGAHTIALDEDRHRVYAFLPETHRASVFEDVAEVIRSS